MLEFFQIDSRSDLLGTAAVNSCLWKDNDFDDAILEVDSSSAETLGTSWNAHGPSTNYGILSSM
jgi:hypothetical protein